MQAVFFILVVCLSGQVLGVELSEHILREKTIPQAWRLLVAGREKQLKESLLAACHQDESGAICVKIVNLIFPSHPTEDSDACNECQEKIHNMLDTIEDVGFDEFKETLIALCIEGANEFGYRGEIMCPGHIHHQLPHLYEAAKKGGAYGLCENTNNCVPPEDASYAKHLSAKYGKLVSGLDPKKANAVVKGAQSRKSRSVNLDDAIKVVQLADIHIEPEYAVGSPTDCGLLVCCTQYYEGATGSAGILGDYHCNIPQNTLNKFLDVIREDIDPYFAIYTGDSPPHSSWDESETSQMLCTELVVASLDSNLTCPVYASIGNHEMFPTNIYYKQLQESVNMTNRFTDLWSPLSSFNEEQEATMRAGGYYSKLASEGLRLITFNSNFMYTMNWYNVLSWDEPEAEAMMTFIEEELGKARINGEKVILIGHHPPGNGDFIISKSRRFIDLWREFKDEIVLQIAGHTHQDEFRLAIDPSTGEADHVVIVAPCMDSNHFRNPSARVFYLDPETFTPLDYDHYYLDLNEDTPEVKHMYRASEEYGMDDLSPASYKDLVDRIEVDDDLLQTHFNNINGRATPEKTCDETCKEELLCKLRTASLDHFDDCLGDGQTPPEHAVDANQT